MKADREQLRSGVEALENLLQPKYGIKLTDLLIDAKRSRANRLWRYDRLVGVTVKEPFAYPETAEPMHSATAAHRQWILENDSFDEISNQQSWQYSILEALIQDDDLRRNNYLGPSFSDLEYLIRNTHETLGSLT